MGRLDKLIKELCPNGVEYRTLGELGKFYGGLTGKSKSDFLDGNSAFITYKNVYSNPALNINPDDTVRITEDENQHVLKYGDVVFTGSSETPDECGFSSVVTKKPEKSLYLNSFCFFYRFNDTDLVRPDFSKYLFRSQNLRYQIGKTASGVTRFNVSKDKMKKVTIPIPPLQVQEEIVRILDNFTELTAELTARKLQYEHYRDSLLTFGDEVKMKPLGEVGSFERGRRFVHADDRETGIPCIHYGELYTHYGISAAEVKTHINRELTTKFRYANKNDVVIVAAGENKVDIGVGVAWLAEFQVAIHDACYIFRHSQNPKYISYFLRTEAYHKQIVKHVSEGKICSISAVGLSKAMIPIPSLAEQQRIVDILDSFDTLCNDISSGLPAEIKARQQQYEYYRNKLLSFKNIDSEV